MDGDGQPKKPRAERRRFPHIDQARYRSDLCLLVINQRPYPILNYSSYGVAVGASDNHPFKENELQAAIFLVNKIEVAKPNLKTARIIPQPNRRVEIGFEIVEAPLCIEKIKAVEHAFDFIHRKQTYTYNRIPSTLRHYVLDLQDFLEEFDQQMCEVKIPEIYQTYIETSSYQDGFGMVMASYLENELTPRLSRLMEKLNDNPTIDRPHFFQYLRSKIRKAMNQKTENYRELNSLEFQFPSMYLKNHFSGNNFQGLARYYQQQPINRAMVERRDLTAQIATECLSAVVKERKRVLSFFSGTGEEWARQFSLGGLTGVSAIDFVDSEQAILDYAKTNLLKTLAGSVTISTQLLSLKDFKNSLPNKSYDLIYVPFAFDYLADPSLAKMVRDMCELLEPKGKIISTHVAMETTNSNLIGMIFSQNWVARYREDLLQLFKGLKLFREVEVRALAADEEESLFFTVELSKVS